MQQSQTPVPGWYPDNVQGPGKLRYWDGTAWTEHVMDANAQCAAPSASSTTDKKAVTTLVLGIISLVVWLIPFLGYPVSIVGLIMGIVSRKSANRGMAMTGLVMCAIGFVLTIANSVLSVYLWSTGQLY